jgi:hypothetical protein
MFSFPFIVLEKEEKWLFFLEYFKQIKIDFDFIPISFINIWINSLYG